MALSLSGDGTLSGVDIAASGLGKVLQVVTADTTTRADIASTTFGDTNLSASITPTSASSTILVFVSQQTRAYREVNNTIACHLQIVRGSTSIAVYQNFNGGRAGLSGGSDIFYYAQGFAFASDSPNTTSSTTYKTQIRSSTVSNNAYVSAQIDSGRSFMVLVEVAA